MGALNIVGACCGKPTNGPGSGLPPCLQRAKDGSRFTQVRNRESTAWQFVQLRFETHLLHLLLTGAVWGP